MVAAQERGIEYLYVESEDGWMPRVPIDASPVWAAIEEALGFGDRSSEGPFYGRTLTAEGEAFRQRFVAYVPPEEAGS